MKKLVLVVLSLVVLAAMGFAQDTKAELYGKVEVDYEFTNEDADADPMQFGSGNFKLDDAEFGFKYQFHETLSAKWEVEAKSMTAELNELYFAWEAVDSLTIMGGYMDENLGPNMLAGSVTGLSVGYDLDVASIMVEAGNADGTVFDLKVTPLVMVTPDLGEDMSVEVIAGAQIMTPADSAIDPLVNGALTVDFGVSSLGLTLEAVLANLSSSNNGDLGVPFFAGLAYEVAIAEPYAEVEIADLLADEMAIDLEVGCGIEPVDSLSVTPFVALSDITSDDLGWEFTLRFTAKPKIKF